MFSYRLTTQKILSNRVSQRERKICVSIFGTHNGLTVVPTVKLTANMALNTTLIKFPVASCPVSFRSLYFIKHTEKHIRHNIIETVLSLM